jgi:hypothetical protein
MTLATPALPCGAAAWQPIALRADRHAAIFFGVRGASSGRALERRQGRMVVASR